MLWSIAAQPSHQCEMRATLRRSCDSCAKAKHRCDLQTPRCSRCIRRKAQCVYANQPLTSSSPDSSGKSSSQTPDNVHAELTTIHEPMAMTIVSEPPMWLFDPANTAYDPFDSYPPTRLPRPHVQRLIHHCMISFVKMSLNYANRSSLIKHCISILST